MGTTAQKLAALAEVKADIADAITAKGGTVPTKFIDYGDAIRALPGGSSKLPSVVDKSVTSIVASDLSEVTKIGQYAFSWCNYLASVVIPNTVTNIANNAFYWCIGLTSVSIPNSVTTVGTNVFRGCSSLTSVTIGSGLTEIGQGMFSECTSLTSITIPDTVTSIAGYAFYNSSSLATIDFGSTRNTVPTLDNYNSFTGLANNYQILVPSALLTTWKAASGWSNISSHIVAHP